jgi:hypothetical protein
VGLVGRGQLPQYFKADAGRLINSLSQTALPEEKAFEGSNPHLVGGRIGRKRLARVFTRVGNPLPTRACRGPDEFLSHSFVAQG